MFETEEDAARQYDRALILEKVRLACWGCCLICGCWQAAYRRWQAGSCIPAMQPRIRQPSMGSLVWQRFNRLPARFTCRAVLPRPTSPCETMSGRLPSTRRTWWPCELAGAYDAVMQRCLPPSYSLAERAAKQLQSSATASASQATNRVDTVAISLPALNRMAARPSTCRCGTAFGAATHAIASELTLPRHREATADEKKRSAVIYAESLRCALAAAAPVPVPRAGRR